MLLYVCNKSEVTNMKRDACGLLIKQINDALEKNANNRLRSEDLTQSQVSLLMELRNKDDGKLSMKDLEKVLHVAQPTVVGIVSRLEQKSYVCSLGDTDDKRIKIVQITEEGIRKCESAGKVMEDTERRMLRGMTKEEQLETKRLLGMIRNNLIDN